MIYVPACVHEMTRTFNSSVWHALIILTPFGVVMSLLIIYKAWKFKNCITSLTLSTMRTYFFGKKGHTYTCVSPKFHRPVFS